MQPGSALMTALNQTAKSYTPQTSLITTVETPATYASMITFGGPEDPTYYTETGEPEYVFDQNLTNYISASQTSQPDKDGRSRTIMWNPDPSLGIKATTVRVNGYYQKANSIITYEDNTTVNNTSYPNINNEQFIVWENLDNTKVIKQIKIGASTGEKVNGGATTAMYYIEIDGKILYDLPAGSKKLTFQNNTDLSYFQPGDVIKFLTGVHHIYHRRVKVFISILSDLPPC